MNNTKPARSVVHVITTIGRGGAENHLVDLITGQVEAGWTVSVAFLKSDGDQFWRGRFEAMGVKTLDMQLTRYGQLPPIFRLRRFLKEAAPTIVHAHMPPAELYTRLAMLFDRTPLIVSKHLDKTFFDGPGTQLLERWCTGRAGAVIAISHAVARYFSDSWPQSMRDRIEVIHYGLDPAPYIAVSDADVQRARENWGIRPGELVIGTVSRLTPQKALDVMIRAFAKTAKAAPEQPMRLIIVGRGHMGPELTALAEALDVGDRMILGGYREDVPTVMRAFDVFALTSDFEGFGLVLIEAMSASRPVLATASSAIPEVVDDGVTGILAPRQDDDAVAAAMTRLLNPNLRKQMGEAGLKRVKEGFAPEVMVRKTLALYEAVIAKAR